MKRMALIVDVSNIYYSLRNLYKNAHLSYKAMEDFLIDLGVLVSKDAYGSNSQGQAKGFIGVLKGMGYETHFKAPKTYKNKEGIRHKNDWDVGIAIRMVEIANDPGEVDTIVLCSGDGDMVPAVEYCKKRGLTVYALGAKISSELAEACDESIEIPASFLQKGK